MPVLLNLSPKVQDPMSGWKLASEETPSGNAYRVVVVSVRNDWGAFRLLCGWWQGGTYWEVDNPEGTVAENFRVLLWHDNQQPIRMQPLYSSLEGEDPPVVEPWGHKDKYAKFQDPEADKARIKMFLSDAILAEED